MQPGALNYPGLSSSTWAIRRRRDLALLVGASLLVGLGCWTVSGEQKRGTVCIYRLRSIMGKWKRTLHDASSAAHDLSALAAMLAADLRTFLSVEEDTEGEENGGHARMEVSSRASPQLRASGRRCTFATHAISCTCQAHTDLGTPDVTAAWQRPVPSSLLQLLRLLQCGGVQALLQASVASLARGLAQGAGAGTGASNGCATHMQVRARGGA